MCWVERSLLSSPRNCLPDGIQGDGKPRVFQVVSICTVYRLAPLSKRGNSYYSGNGQLRLTLQEHDLGTVIAVPAEGNSISEVNPQSLAEGLCIFSQSR